MPYGPPTAEVSAILARLDFIGAMLNVGFPAEAKAVAARLNDYRHLLPWPDAPALQQARSDVDASAGSAKPWAAQFPSATGRIQVDWAAGRLE